LISSSSAVTPLLFTGRPASLATCILIRPHADHGARMLNAVREFGFPADENSAAYLLEQHKILQLGRPPVQVHLMTNISGVTWQSGWEPREEGSYGSVPVFFIVRSALIANKRAAGRTKDLAHVEELGRSGLGPSGGL
jgi:hypothetical protein